MFLYDMFGGFWRYVSYLWSVSFPDTSPMFHATWAFSLGLGGFSCFPDTPWDWNICRPIDPFQPPQLIGKYGSCMGRVWGLDLQPSQSGPRGFARPGWTTPDFSSTLKVMVVPVGGSCTEKVQSA